MKKKNASTIITLNMTKVKKNEITQIKVEAKPVIKDA